MLCIIKMNTGRVRSSSLYSGAELCKVWNAVLCGTFSVNGNFFANKRLQDLVQWILKMVLLFVETIGSCNPFPALIYIFPSLCQPLDQNRIKSGISDQAWHHSGSFCLFPRQTDILIPLKRKKISILAPLEKISLVMEYNPVVIFYQCSSNDI